MCLYQHLGLNLQDILSLVAQSVNISFSSVLSHFQSPKFIEVNYK